MSGSPSAPSLELARGFDFSARMWVLCDDLCRRLPEFRHIDMGRVQVCIAQTRRAGLYGMQASLTPLRFEAGAVETTIRGRRFRAPSLTNPAGVELLYLLTFYLPRFQDHDYREKLVTVFHELWHVGPQFDGDIRRHAGRCYAHAHSKADFDAAVGQFVDRWLAQAPPAELHEFLTCSFTELVRRYGRVYGVRARRPRLIPAVDLAGDPS